MGEKEYYEEYLTCIVCDYEYEKYESCAYEKSLFCSRYCEVEDENSEGSPLPAGAENA